MLCIDHPEVQAIIPKVRDRRVVTYGFSAQADVRGENVTPYPGGNRFTAVLRQRDGSFRRSRVSNCRCRAATMSERAGRVAVAVEMGVADELIRTGFAKFGASSAASPRWARLMAAIIDDYGHHPVEIRAVLAAAREGVQNRVIAVAAAPLHPPARSSG
jgi:UDP-N-acetylmuramate--alanine ligase